ncbi:MAG: AI-2E family transporter [Acidobacteriota bacterium]|nr:AI-2E family transporter [Acidobacteriota bacterium]
MEKNKVLTVAGALLSIFLIGVFLRLGKSFLIPFVLALFIYFILSPILDLLTRWKLSRGVAMVIVMLVTALVLYLLGVLFYESGKSFASEIPKYGQKFNAMIESIQRTFHLGLTKWDPLVWLKGMNIEKLGSVALSSLGTFLSFLSTFFLVLIFLMFMLAGRGKLNEKIRRSFSAQRGAQLCAMIDQIDSRVQKYLAIKTAISLASGLLTTLILMFFGVDFAVAFGFLTFLLNYIPNIGSFLSKAAPFLLAIVQFSSFWKAVWILAILTVIDAITGMIIEPRLMGRGLGLSPLGILLALFFMGWLWGIPGMILAVPIMAMVKIVCGAFPSLRFLEALLSK